MKHLILIIHTSIQQELADHLRSMEQVSGFTFSDAEGHGKQSENDPFLSVRDKVVGYIPRVRVDVLLDDAHIDTVINALQDECKGFKGHGLYWVTAVEKSGRL